MALVGEWHVNAGSVPNPNLRTLSTLRRRIPYAAVLGLLTAAAVSGTSGDVIAATVEPRAGNAQAGALDMVGSRVAALDDVATVDAPAKGLVDELQQLKAVLEEQQRQLTAQQRQIEHLQRQLTEIHTARAAGPYGEPSDQLPVVYTLPDSTSSAQQDGAALREAGFRVTEPARPGRLEPIAAADQANRETVGERPPEAQNELPDLPAIADLGGVLTEQGTITVEPAFTLSHSSRNRFLFRGVEILPSFLIGVIEVTEAERDYLSASVTSRYGITDRLEANVSVPFVYRSDKINQSSASIGGVTGRRDVEGSDIGDVEFGLQYQINKGSGDWPVIVANARIKTTTGTGPFDVPRDGQGLELEQPTGSGFWGLQPSLTFIKAADPLVFYGNVSYLLNMKKNIDTQIQTLAGPAFIGEVNPGDSFGVSFGGAIGLTENVSASLGYEHYYVFKTKQTQSGFDPATSTFGPLVSSQGETAQVGSLLFGVNVQKSVIGPFSLSLAAGLTDDAPDVQLTIRRPFSFRLFD